MKKDFYTLMLSKNICEVRFTNPYDRTTPKTEYVMNCTLRSEHVDKCFNGIRLVGTLNDDTMNVIDVDRNEWRLLSIANILSFKILTGTIQELPIQISKAASSIYATVMPNKKDMEVHPTMVIKHNLNQLYGKLSNKQPIIKNSLLPARQRWILGMLHQYSCKIVFMTNEGLVCEFRGSLESWALNVAVPEPSLPSDSDPDVMKILDMEDGKWRIVRYSNIVSFETPFTKYEAKTYQEVHPESYKTYRTNMSKEFYVDALRKGICQVEFMKLDGTMRSMSCTLDPKIVVALRLQPTGKYPHIPEPD